MKQKLTIAVMALLLTLGLSPIAHADSVVLTLNAPTTLSGHPGDTLTFFGSVSAPATNGADIFLNGLELTLDVPLVWDTTDFVNSAPIFLAPGFSSTNFAMFTVMIPPGAPAQVYDGVADVIGGADGSAQDTIGSADFAVDVVPEPSSILLFGSGLAGLVGVMRRKRSL